MAIVLFVGLAAAAIIGAVMGSIFTATKFKYDIEKKAYAKFTRAEFDKFMKRFKQL